MKGLIHRPIPVPFYRPPTVAPISNSIRVTFQNLAPDTKHPTWNAKPFSCYWRAVNAEEFAIFRPLFPYLVHDVIQQFEYRHVHGFTVHAAARPAWRRANGRGRRSLGPVCVDHGAKNFLDFSRVWGRDGVPANGHFHQGQAEAPDIRLD